MAAAATAVAGAALAADAAPNRRRRRPESWAHGPVGVVVFPRSADPLGCVARPGRPPPCLGAPRLGPFAPKPDAGEAFCAGPGWAALFCWAAPSIFLWAWGGAGGLAPAPCAEAWGAPCDQGASAQAWGRGALGADWAADRSRLGLAGRPGLLGSRGQAAFSDRPLAGVPVRPGRPELLFRGRIGRSPRRIAAN